ncbi:MAG: hypothetical protein N4A35_17035 [Flavobacteriales bacterium]|jgi:hypothetical protein|nr:hypothetical protein [Flavobacteriales bacterium]
MKKRTEGAWIIHHAKKLQEVSNIPDFDDVDEAGKCGLLLSCFSATNEESVLDKNKVNAVSDTLNISKRFELPVLLNTLKENQLIDVSKNGEVRVLGLTTSNVLTHTADIFNEKSNNYQKASLELTNYSSDKPIKETVLKEYIADTYKLDSKTNEKLFNQSEEIGIVDYEILDEEKNYFNGNLFKREAIVKTQKVLDSLIGSEEKLVKEVDDLITNDGCVLIETAEKILGAKLLARLQSIAMYDFNEVSNNSHSKVFLTKPSSFAKYGNPFEEDALDMAKAFITSLVYGLKISSFGRGRIQGSSMLVNTLRKLIRGERVGPCTAIGEDYQVLELNRVIKLEHYHGTMYYMRLLKYDIAKLALSVIENGDLAEDSTLGSVVVGSSNVSCYIGPEKNRQKIRKRREASSGKEIGELIRTIRN